ncbi:meiotic recombination protein SPO11-like protein [Vairimorpha necatrix]|uniref:DNA topoisomerase (ATP-hydrolyzing) n=1 Tax=Vairimorpha necatrix TaxID=6039 RepID=A0AAX4JGY2_9MICR
MRNFLRDLTRHTLRNISKFPNILQRLKFYEELNNSLLSNTKKNKREIYYNSVEIFKSQSSVDRLIKETCIKLKCTQSDLLISTTLKGIYYGNIVFYKNNKEIINCRGTSLIPDMSEIERVECKSKMIIVVEKDTIFSKIIRSKNQEDTKDVLNDTNLKSSDDILFICGKGYPCHNTLALVNKLKHIKMYGIFDFDPYGVEICTKYKTVQRIGVRREDINKENVLELTENDIKRIRSLIKKGICVEDMEYMLENNIKMEIEGIFNRPGFDILEYIRERTE